MGRFSTANGEYILTRVIEAFEDGGGKTGRGVGEMVGYSPVADEVCSLGWGEAFVWVDFAINVD
ncbi:MAG: hypothetical protein DBP01_03145 [gamma proteobacterium symbiont of Ctena orbiculata]|nr:MAG: hypothetical protein DBP01_03145 [gamma proteobacterium symbiont of Ctena orbiculata]